MTKRELVLFIAERMGVRPFEAARMYDAFIEAMETALTQGNSVTLVRFGTFRVRQRKTGAYVAFKPSRALLGRYRQEETP